METGNRPPRAFEHRLALRLAAGKHKTRAVMQVLQATGNDAHHAFVKVLIEHAQRSRCNFFAVHQGLGDQQRLFAHIALHRTAFAVDGVELLRQSPRQFAVIGAQALDAQRHV